MTVKTRSQQRAKRHGPSAEAEVRDILRNAVKGEGPDQQPLGSRLRARSAGIGLTDDLEALPGEAARPATFDE